MLLRHDQTWLWWFLALRPLQSRRIVFYQHGPLPPPFAHLQKLFFLWTRWFVYCARYHLNPPSLGLLCPSPGRLGCSLLIYPLSAAATSYTERGMDGKLPAFSRGTELFMTHNPLENLKQKCLIWVHQRSVKLLEISLHVDVWTHDSVQPYHQWYLSVSMRLS